VGSSDSDSVEVACKGEQPSVFFDFFGWDTEQNCEIRTHFPQLMGNISANSLDMYKSGG